jgi:hypothetical protein
MFDPRVRLWVASGERRRGQRNQARHLIYVKECTTRRACVNDSEPPAPNSARAEFRPGRRSQAKAGVGKSQKTVGEITDSDGHDSPRGLGMRGRRIPPLCLDSRPLWERRRRRLRATLQRLTCPTDIRVSFKFQQSVINGLFKALRTPGRHTPRAHHTAGQRGRAGRRRPRGRSGHRRRRTASDASRRCSGSRPRPGRCWRACRPGRTATRPRTAGAGGPRNSRGWRGRGRCRHRGRHPGGGAASAGDASTTGGFGSAAPEQAVPSASSEARASGRRIRPFRPFGPRDASHASGSRASDDGCTVSAFRGWRREHEKNLSDFGTRLGARPDRHPGCRRARGLRQFGREQQTRGRPGHRGPGHVPRWPLRPPGLGGRRAEPRGRRAEARRRRDPHLRTPPRRPRTR